MSYEIDGPDLCASPGCRRDAIDFPYCLKHGEQVETYDRADPYGDLDEPDCEGD